MYARAADRLAKAGIKSIAMKYFFFNRTGASDESNLAKRVQSVPTLLQYAVVGDGGSATEHVRVPYDKMRATVARVASQHLTKNARVVLPIESCSMHAVSLGFVDAIEPFDADFLPLLGSFDGVIVGSLWLQLLEQQYGARRSPLFQEHPLPPSQ